MRLKINPIEKCQVALVLQALLMGGILYVFLYLPFQTYNEQHLQWKKVLGEKILIMKRLEDRKLLEAYDETFRLELDQSLQKLKPFLKNQEYVRELGQLCAENNLEIKSLEVFKEKEQVRISLQLEGKLEDLLKCLHRVETHAMPMRIKEWQTSPVGNQVQSRFILLLKEIS